MDRLLLLGYVGMRVWGDYCGTLAFEASALIRRSQLLGEIGSFDCPGLRCNQFFRAIKTFGLVGVQRILLPVPKKDVRSSANDHILAPEFSQLTISQPRLVGYENQSPLACSNAGGRIGSVISALASSSERNSTRPGLSCSVGVATTRWHWSPNARSLIATNWKNAWIEESPALRVRTELPSHFEMPKESPGQHGIESLRS